MAKNKSNISSTILNTDWVYGYERRMGFRLMNLFYDGYTRAFNKFFKTKFEGNLYRIQNGTVALYFPGKNAKENSLKITKYLDSRNSYKNIKREIINNYVLFNKYIEKMPLSYSSKTNKELIAHLNNFLKNEEKISCAIRILFNLFEDILLTHLDKMLSKFETPDKLNIKKTITLPTILLPLDEYLIDVSKVKRGKRKMDWLSKKYSSLGMFEWFYEEYKKSDHLIQIEKMSRESAQRIENEVKTRYKKRKMENDAIISKFKNSKKILELLDLLSLYANYKEWKSFWREKASFKLSVIFDEISKRLNIEKKLLIFMTYKEIEFALNTANSIDIEKIKNRSDNSIFIFESKGVEVVTENDLLLKFDNKFKEKKLSEITGLPTFKGKIIGNVKLVISSDDFHKMKKGDILVTSTTRPDYIKVMELAGAFITNEGGLLSHAAILAREMKKPCIIGTKIATKVLKDGDLVEVDANKGIIKLLNK